MAALDVQDAIETVMERKNVRDQIGGPIIQLYAGVVAKRLTNVDDRSSARANDLLFDSMWFNIIWGLLNVSHEERR